MWLIYATVLIYLADLTTGEQPKIIIIGAGASGIAAASKLYENGFQDVTILEAEDRIGGRIFTTRFDEYWVDIGGQWVHGQEGNIAYELASPLDLLEVPNVEDRVVKLYNSEGREIPQAVANALLTLFENTTENAFEDLTESNGAIDEYFTRMTLSGVQNIPGANETLARGVLKLFEGMENAEDGSENWNNTSARGFSVETWVCAGSEIVNWKDRGYGTILDILMKKYPNPENELPVRNNTKLNSEVVKIDYNSTEGKVLVKLENGEEYSADHVIVTPSLGVLKAQYETLFTPELPEFKVKTIKGLAFGSVGKIFMSFEAPWWPDTTSGFLLLWTESDREEMEKDENKKWLLDIVAFAPVPHKPRLLYVWVNAPGARKMEVLPEDEVLDQIISLLHRFLGNSYNITTPTGLIRSQWYSNKHFRGTYSFRSMESEAANVWADDLAAPLMVNDKPVVMFAGEASHPHYYSNVHGAIETGFREAKTLINLYNITEY